MKFHKSVYAIFVYVLILIGLLVIFVFLNFLFVGEGSNNINRVMYVFKNWNNISLGSDLFIKRELWAIGATLIAGIGLSLAAISAQALTNNPIAEGSTLGLSQASIFGILFATSFGLSSLLYKYVFAIVAQAVSAGLLISIIAFSRTKNNKQKVILIGLAIGIIFKTMSFIFRQGDQSQSALSYVYVLGGAEVVSSNPMAIAENEFEITILISLIFVSLAVLLSVFNIKGMNVLALSEDKAKTLGQNLVVTKVISVIILVLTVPAAVIIVGNLAFLGLFSAHFARWFTKSRDYKKVLPMSILIGCLIASFGYQLSQFVPQINSGIWMTFVGAPYLIYLGVKGLR